MPGDVTLLLQELQEGDTDALERLMPLIYDELRQMARWMLTRERADHTLNATALVNEVYLKLVNQNRLAASHRSEFLAISSRTMRNILVDYARARNRAKRGGGLQAVSLDSVEHLLSDQEAEEVLALDEALQRLERVNDRAAAVVQYRFYAGLTLEETAEQLQVSTKTVQRSWDVALAWLRKEVTASLPPT